MNAIPRTFQGKGDFQNRFLIGPSKEKEISKIIGIGRDLASSNLFSLRPRRQEFIYELQIERPTRFGFCGRGSSLMVDHVGPKDARFHQHMNPHTSAAYNALYLSHPWLFA
ncbi:hypothetical protein VNO77_03234 [Canavalia gladiata]|uniref:Uncharacterized protein n=1 Tax=Canavalia gladiata TaxID=3824 RepID=A0AAN9RC13_CANGL